MTKAPDNSIAISRLADSRIFKTYYRYVDLWVYGVKRNTGQTTATIFSDWW
ncbi:MAG: hypothetical protein HYV28_04460 [Ignavibacteriales bacterium]|nr:hypothetical protein [Ignavibacteriales bacterium]